MKTFHSKMMLCDVLAEREAQVALKEELGKLEQIREERYLEMEKASYRNMLERELREKDNLGKAAQMAAEMQKAQLKEATDKHLRHIEDDILEGEMLRQKAAEDLRGERLAEKKRRQQAVQALAETQKANAYLKQLRAEDELREQREEEKNPRIRFAQRTRPRAPQKARGGSFPGEAGPQAANDRQAGRAARGNEVERRRAVGAPGPRKRDER